MSTKNSLQYIIESVAASTGESRKVAEQFSKAFFDTIVEALYMGETSIKIKGLGTFKLVEVDSRESVNVADGERITIPAYKKVTFVPDDEVAERMTARAAAVEKKNHEKVEDENVADYEAVSEQTDFVYDVAAEQEVVEQEIAEQEVVEQEVFIENEEIVDSIEEADSTNVVEGIESEKDAAVSEDVAVPHDTESIVSIDNLIVPGETVDVEQPRDGLSGIDLLIATPESIEEVREQLEEARRKADAAIAAAKLANTERHRLEKMLERLEAKSMPEERVGESHPAAESPAKSIKDELVGAIENESMEVVEEKSVESADEASLPEPAVATEKVEVDEHCEDVDKVGEMDDTAKANDAEDADDVEDTNDDSENEDSDAADKEEPKTVATHHHSKSKHTSRKVKRNRRLAGIAAVLAVLLCGGWYAKKHLLKPDDTVVDANVVEILPPRKSLLRNRSAAADSAAVARADSIRDRFADSIFAATLLSQRASEAADQLADGQRTIPTECVLKKGESLTILSVRYYGTKDSVPAIIRFNRFKDPNKIPIGSTIYLP